MCFDVNFDTSIIHTEFSQPKNTRRFKIITTPLPPVSKRKNSEKGEEGEEGQGKDTNVGVLEPCVEDKPHVGDAQRGHVKSEHVPYTKRHRPSSQQANHGNNANIREPHL